MKNEEFAAALLWQAVIVMLNALQRQKEIEGDRRR